MSPAITVCSESPAGTRGIGVAVGGMIVGVGSGVGVLFGAQAPITIVAKIRTGNTFQIYFCMTASHFLHTNKKPLRFTEIRGCSYPRISSSHLITAYR
jgi:hypothetical protein